MMIELNLNLEKAVQDDKVMQSFEIELLTSDEDHSLMVKVPRLLAILIQKIGANYRLQLPFLG